MENMNSNNVINPFNEINPVSSMGPTDEMNVNVISNQRTYVKVTDEAYQYLKQVHIINARLPVQVTDLSATELLNL